MKKVIAAFRIFHVRLTTSRESGHNLQRTVRRTPKLVTLFAVML